MQSNTKMEVFVMIQIYSPRNTNYNLNGDMTLFPEVCEASSKLGGAWSLEITHPIDDEGRWKYIEREAVLSVPTFMGKNQLYRIVQITDKNDAEISAKAYPIFYDSADEIFWMDKRPTGKNGQETLNDLTEGTKYSGESNITTAKTAYFVRRNLMDCISGNDYPSFVQVWGGEPLYNNYKIIVNKRAGGDYGAEIRYGKNLVGVNASEDMSEVVTRIVPVAYNGRTLSNEYVDSPLISSYAKVYVREIKFEDVRYFEDIEEVDDTDEIIVCNSQKELDAALTKKCEEQFEAGIDLFKATIEVDMVSLENTEEYKAFQDLVRIGLGDDVSCYNTRIGIQTKARAIEVVWDCITDSVKTVVLGDYQDDFLEQWNSSIDQVKKVLNKDGTLMAEKVQGILNGIYTQLKIQSTAAQKVEGRAFCIEDLDESSPLYGCMIIGTQGLQISTKRTADGRDWDWATAITAKGIIADAIITGLLSDKKGNNYWDLDTGEFSLSASAFQVDNENVKDYVLGNMTQLEVFNKLTNNGETQGIYMKNGKLYINGTYMQIGKISDSTGSNYWDLETGVFKLAKGNIALGDLFKVDEKGNLVANSLKSTNAEITGGNIQIDGIAANFYPIIFNGKSGDSIKLGPDNAIWKDAMEDCSCMISGYQIALGKNTGSTSFSGDVTIDPIFGITSQPTYDQTKTNAANLFVDSVGGFYRSSSSSERYKTDITEHIIQELDPKHLYDVPVKMFKYKDGYLSKGDAKNGQNVIGFIVEDMERYYPAAVQYEKGLPEMWNANIIIPAMMKLLQEQNERIKKLEGNDNDN